MKKTLLLLVAAISFVSSCKDDADNPADSTSLTTAEKVQHQWSLESILDYNYIGSSTTLDYIDTFEVSAGDFLDFRTDNKVYMSFDGELDTTNYLIVDDNNIDFDGDRFEITTLTTSKFVVTYKDRSEPPYYDNVVIMTR